MCKNEWESELNILKYLKYIILVWFASIGGL